MDTCGSVFLAKHYLRMVVLTAEDSIAVATRGQKSYFAGYQVAVVASV